jgi:hypothetical protein
VVTTKTWSPQNVVTTNVVTGENVVTTKRGHQ